MKTNWEGFNDAGEVERFLDRSIPINSSEEEVIAFAKSHNLVCAPIIKGIIRCTAPARSKSRLIGAKWLIEFHFRDGALAKVSVALGLTGP